MLAACGHGLVLISIVLGLVLNCREGAGKYPPGSASDWVFDHRADLDDGAGRTVREHHLFQLTSS